MQVRLVDARDVITNRRRFNRPMLRILEQANSYECPAGLGPSRGYILLTRGDYERLDPYDVNLRLHIGTMDPIPGLSIVRTQCVTAGIPGSSNAVLLVEITDGRGIVYNDWFQQPTSRVGYNCNAPAYPGTYYTETLDGSSMWTWNTMIQDMWPLPSAYAGLPSDPSGMPEDVWCAGEAVWPLLCRTLSHLGMTVAPNPPLGTYDIVTSNAADATFTALQTTYRTSLEDDLAWVDEGAGRYPLTIKVLFRRRNEFYGGEETVRRDSLQFDTTPYYTVSTTGPYAEASGTHFIHDDFTVRYDVEGQPLAADVSTATVLAGRRVTQYFAKERAPLHQVYGGALPFRPGSQVDCVKWQHTQNGWRTTIT